MRTVASISSGEHILNISGVFIQVNYSVETDDIGTTNDIAVHYKFCFISNPKLPE